MSLRQRDVQTANLLVVFVTLLPLVLDVPVGVSSSWRRLSAAVAAEKAQENCQINPFRPGGEALKTWQ